jgi:hypothetical protein
MANAMTLFSNDWFICSKTEHLKVFMVVDASGSEFEHIHLSKSLAIQKDLTWSLFIHGKMANNLQVFLEC